MRPKELVITLDVYSDGTSETGESQRGDDGHRTESHVERSTKEVIDQDEVGD